MFQWNNSKRHILHKYKADQSDFDRFLLHSRHRKQTLISQTTEVFISINKTETSCFNHRKFMSKHTTRVQAAAQHHWTKDRIRDRSLCREPAERDSAGHGLQTWTCAEHEISPSPAWPTERAPDKTTVSDLIKRAVISLIFYILEGRDPISFYNTPHQGRGSAWHGSIWKS